MFTPFSSMSSDLPLGADSLVPGHLPAGLSSAAGNQLCDLREAKSLSCLCLLTYKLMELGESASR